jgi:hypothetical protein
MGLMYMGTLEKMQMVRCALSEWDVGNTGYAEVLNYVNGGADVVSSFASSRTFDLSWSGTPNEINPIKHYQQGYYGNGLIYLSDPMTWHYNVIPPNWASPRLIEVGDWKNIYDTTPTFANTASNVYNQPKRTATWNITTAAGGVPTKVLTIPIPPSQTLYVGFSGAVTGTGVVRTRPVNSDGSYGATIDLTPLSATGATRTSWSFTGYSAVQIYLTRTSSATSTVSVTSMLGQIWSGGVTPTPGPHIPGEGFTGLKFASAVHETYYQAAGVGRERKGASVALVEAESWL